MARRRRRSERDEATSFSNAPPALRSLYTKILKAAQNAYTGLRALEDRRTFSPELFRPARATIRSAARIVPHAQRPASKGSRFRTVSLQAPAGLRFADSRRVAICIRRHSRREVLHALNHVGRGKSVRKPIFNEWSDIKCKK